MTITIDRKELVAIIKELNLLEVAPKLFTKNVEDFELLIKFLETVESIPEGSKEEDALSQEIIKFYNRMAKKVEQMDSAAILETVANDDAIKTEKPKSVKDLEDFVEKKKDVPTKTKMIEITDIMQFVGEDSIRDVFGNKATTKNSKMLKILISGKSESYLVKKGIVDDKNTVMVVLKDMRVKLKGHLEITTTEDENGRVRHKFFVTKEYAKTRKK